MKDPIRNFAQFWLSWSNDSVFLESFFSRKRATDYSITVVACLSVWFAVVIQIFCQWYVEKKEENENGFVWLIENWISIKIFLIEFLQSCKVFVVSTNKNVIYHTIFFIKYSDKWRRKNEFFSIFLRENRYKKNSIFN